MFSSRGNGDGGNELSSENRAIVQYFMAKHSMIGKVKKGNAKAIRSEAILFDWALG